MCLTWIDSQGHITRRRFDFVGGRADVVTGRVDGNIEKRQNPLHWGEMDTHSYVMQGKGVYMESNQCHIYLQKSWSFANKNKDLILKKQWFCNIFSMAIATNLCATLILFCVPVKCEHAIMVPPPPCQNIARKWNAQKKRCKGKNGILFLFAKCLFLAILHFQFFFVCKKHIYFVLNTFICKYMWHWFDSVAFRMYLSSVTHTYHQWPWAAAVERCYWHYSFAICRPVSAFPPRSGRSARCSRSILSSRQHCRWAVMEPLEYNKNTRSSQHAHLWPGLAKWVWMHTG